MVRGPGLPPALYAPLQAPCDHAAPADSRWLVPAEERAVGLVSRLVLNLAVALDDRAGPPAATFGPVTRRRKGDKRRRVVSLAGASDRALRLDVANDLREHVSDYLSGDAKRLYKARRIVRGHWRNQPWGPGGSLRRLIWIAPFWKGPEA
jgi:hypothetical protein